MAKRRRREYLVLLDKAKAATETGIDSFNRVNHPYRNETTLILLSNGWELLAKAVLVQARRSIKKGHRGDTISAESAISRLLHHKEIKKHEAETVQQIISLRNTSSHHHLPDIPDEIMHHLLFFGCKFFRELVSRKFPSHAKDLERNYLSLSFSDLTTYADKVQKLVSRVKKSPSDKKLIWLLERGIEFDGSSYITEKQFEQKYRGKMKIMPHLRIGEFLKGTDMVRIVPVEAPRNYTADVTLRKGSAKDSSLPVIVKKTDLEHDYPYLTKELARSLGKNLSFVAKAMDVLKLRGDPKFHQAVRSSKTSYIHRYSDAAKSRLEQKLRDEPEFSPYKSV
jgi:hypothetical protein